MPPQKRKPDPDLDLHLSKLPRQHPPPTLSRQSSSSSANFFPQPPPSAPPASAPGAPLPVDTSLPTALPSSEESSGASSSSDDAKTRALGGGGGGSSTTTAAQKPEDKKMPPYKSKVRVLEKYRVVGFISSGTYGRVYKAQLRAPGDDREFAIKKFKPDKEDAPTAYTGISQSAIREMSLCSELHHENLIHLHEIILEDKCIYMVFDYAEHDLLQIIHFHSQQPNRAHIPTSTIKSVLWQLLNGVSYLHQNWVLHRDLKPANIMVTAAGELKIGDLGLARLFWKPLQSLYTGDKVVVTIWYRAPELLLGSKHYTAAIDLWAVGCIFAELLALRPIFKGEEAKMEKKSTVPFQRNQLQKILEILGTPDRTRWPSVNQLPEAPQLQGFKAYPDMLERWWENVGGRERMGTHGYDLLRGLLTYDPTQRLTARKALEHPFFEIKGGAGGGQEKSGGFGMAAGKGSSGGGGAGDVVWGLNAFEGQKWEYPNRRVTKEDADFSVTGTKRSALGAAAQEERGGKRVKEA